MTDHDATLQQLKARVKAFAVARDWLPFHNGKNLAMSMAIESAELMEHFQWTPTTEPVEDKAEIAEELADVMIYALAFANCLDIDIAAAIAAKLQKNEDRFPVGTDGQTNKLKRQKNRTEQG